MTVVRKEAIDTFRDHRSLGTSLLFAVLMPALLYVMLTNLAASVEEESTIDVAVAGADEAPTLLGWLSERDVAYEVFDSEDEAIGALGEEFSVALVFPDDYADRYLDRSPAPVSIFGDFKSQSIENDAGRLRDLISAYGSQVAAARLIADGVAPPVTQPIAVERYDLSRVGGASAYFSGMLTYFFLLGGFLSGAFMAADAVAGERERHSLQPLLAQPVTPMQLIIGKWVIASVVACFVSTVTIVLGGILLSLAPLAELGLRFSTTPLTLALAAISALPLAMFATSLQLFLSARAKTYREAATYAQFTMFLPLLVIGSTVIADVDYGAFADFLPVAGHDFAIRELFLEGRVPLLPILVTSITTLAVTAALIVFSAKTLGNEKALGT
jgi:sodium transport system permease protein